MQSPDEHGRNPPVNPANGGLAEEQEFIDLRDLFKKLGRGLGQILGLAMLGTVLAVVGCLTISPRRSSSTITRVVFSFPGFEKGEYPDGSKFQPDDLFAPDIIMEALQKQGLDTSTSEFQSEIRGAFGIEGTIPPDVVKTRDRLRLLGQSPPPYMPDEYVVTLTLPRNFPLSNQQRERLLSEIASAYREKFQRTYVNAPVSFGNVFMTLHDVDYPQYELIFDKEIEHITTYLGEQLEQAKSFRSPTTNLSFKDLMEQTQSFAQVQLNDALAIIHQSGLSQNRAIAIVRMDYSLQVLEDAERHALEDEKVVRDLLAQTQTQTQNYVLGIKSQLNQPRSESPTLDQGLINSLLANDAYNFLVRRALDAGLQVKAVQAEKAQLVERLDALKLAKDNAADNAAIVAQVQKLLAELEPAYQELIANIRKTQDDFAHQQFANAIRVTDAVTTSGRLRALEMFGIGGCLLGLVAGMGLSLTGIYIGSAKQS